MSKTMPGTGTTAGWSDRTALLRQVQKWWDRGHLLQLLATPRPGEAPQPLQSFFPARLVFKTPDSKALSAQFDEVRQWVARIHQLKGLRIVEKTVQHRIIGENRLPAEIWVETLDDALRLLGKQAEANDFQQLWSVTEAKEPALLPWVIEHPLKALSLVADWDKLLAFVAWRKAHPQPGIYLRQVSIPGVDSKFIEQHRATLIALLDGVLPADQIQPAFSGAKQFAERYGFNAKPLRIRFRLLHASLGTALGLTADADRDLTLSLRDFSQLEANRALMAGIERVFMTENEINFLAFPDLPNSLVIFGAGYGFDAFARITWLQRLPVFYWGDLDTHGFAILDQLRSYLPQVTSLLMDRQTLLDHQALWGREEQPVTRPLPRLTGDETRTYEALVNHTYGERLRLEQEQVGFEYLLRALHALK